jgi:hypothetical protein
MMLPANRWVSGRRLDHRRDRCRAMEQVCGF